MKRKRIQMRFILFALLLLMSWIFWSNTSLTVRTITISSDRLPKAFSGLRIAHISDLHNASFGEDNAALLQMLAENKPDLIAITGDLIDSRRTDIDIALNFAEEASQIAPVYYVTGNHESRISQYPKLKTGLEALGVTVLEDTCVLLAREGQTIRFAGLNDPAFGPSGDPAAGVSEKLETMLTDDSVYTILLSHRPELFDTYAAHGIDLTLSGHAHGGQIRIPFLGGVIAPNQGLFPPYDSGLYSQAETNMVVSRGLGNSLFPFRVNNRPEIIFIELR